MPTASTRAARRQRTRARGAWVLVVGVTAAACTGGSDGASTTVSMPSEITTTTPPGPGFTIPPVPGSATPWTVDTSVCAQPDEATAAIENVLVIGTTAPQSGGLVSSIYAPVLAGMQAYIDRANDEDLLDGIEIRLEVADDKGQAELSPVAVSGLIDAGASLITGMPGTANNLAVRDYLNTNCVPQILSNANSTRLGDPTRYPWTMGGVVTDSLEVTVFADVIRRTLGEGATLGVIATDDVDGSDYTAAVTAAADDNDLDVIVRQTVPPADFTAPTAQVLITASSAPDAVLVSVDGPACATVLTELATVIDSSPSWRPVIYLADSCADVSLLRLAGDAADGVLTAATLVDPTEEFVEEMNDRGVTTGVGRAELGWTLAEVTVAIAVQAQQSSDGLTRASLIEAARSMDLRPEFAWPGIAFVTNGVVDAFPVESIQIVRYDATDQRFAAVGEVVAQFES